MVNVNEKIIGDRILMLLKEKGLTQKDLATKVGITEVSMSRYITGFRTPKGPIIANIANALNTTTDYLLGGEGNDDFETKYRQTQNWIARNAKNMTPEQKNGIASALFVAAP